MILAEWKGDVARETGAIVRHGLTKVAVNRDSANQVYRYSAVCPHLQGIVHWNSVEKTWDCPCHGSRFDRFDRFGSVLNGPAISGLDQAESRRPGGPETDRATDSGRSESLTPLGDRRNNR